MASRNRPKQPIMTPGQERFMAFEGVLQWAQAVVRQAERLLPLCQFDRTLDDQEKRHRAILERHTECHYFAIAAYQFVKYRDWARSFGLFSNIDFTEIDRLATYLQDVRDMREHVIDYFSGTGKFPDRWRHETPEFEADASSLNGTMIGGRLDWKAFAAAVQGIEPQLWAEPIPYPPIGP